jgi:hypothetical protein
LAAIGIDGSCYTDLSPAESVDLQGWNSNHPIFREVIERHRPRLVCEIGTWKGTSVLYMHSLAKQMGLKTRFICIDTWMGSNDTLWLQPDLRALLRLTAGFPDLFRQFVHNGTLKRRAGRHLAFPDHLDGGRPRAAQARH